MKAKCSNCKKEMELRDLRVYALMPDVRLPFCEKCWAAYNKGKPHKSTWSEMPRLRDWFVKWHCPERRVTGVGGRLRVTSDSQRVALLMGVRKRLGQQMKLERAWEIDLIVPDAELMAALKDKMTPEFEDDEHEREIEIRGMVDDYDLHLKFTVDEKNKPED